MRITVRPVVDPRREVDLTDRLVAVIAEELWLLYGGNDKLNWLEAERHLERIVGEVRPETRSCEPKPAPSERCERRVSRPRARRAGGSSRAPTAA